MAERAVGDNQINLRLYCIQGWIIKREDFIRFMI